MGVIFAVICVLGSTTAIILTSTLGLTGWLKAAIVVPAVLLAVYSMARIQPKGPEVK